jgi:PAS domain-containing protein
VEKTFAYYLPMNPLFKIAPLMKAGFIVTNGDVIPTDEFQRTEFYDGWARPQQLCSPLTLVLHRADSVYCPLTLVRPDGTGEATDDDRALLKRLAPHLIRAMRVSMQLDLLRHQRFAMEQSLTRMTIAVLLLDRQRRVVFANPAAERLLASGTGLITVRGALAARASRSNQQLKEAILEVIREKPGASSEIKIEREHSRPLHLTTLPIAPEAPFMPLLEELPAAQSS